MSRHTRIVRMPSWHSTATELMYEVEWRYERRRKGRLHRNPMKGLRLPEWVEWYEKEVRLDIVRTKKVKGQEMFWSKPGRILKPKR